jgi:hypothetical protein
MSAVHEMQVKCKCVKVAGACAYESCVGELV